MAEKRMFSAKIIESHAFLDIPATAQMLYFHICMNADDDGFVNNPRKIIRMCGASEDDLKSLIDNRFLLSFDSGVMLVKHWRIHNYIPPDRYKPSQNPLKHIPDRLLLFFPQQYSIEYTGVSSLIGNRSSNPCSSASS